MDVDLEQLEVDARRIKKELPSDHKPVVIEFAGSPKAGKSTTIDILAHFFKRMGFQVWAPTEGASKRTPYHLKRNLIAFNTWTLNYAISELLVAYFNVDHQDLIILDRGPYDSLAWLGLLKKQSEDENKLTDKEFEILRDFAVNTRWSALFSRVYLFECSVETSLARENESKLTQEPGTAMNEAMLTALLREYKAMKQEFKGNRLFPVATSYETTPQTTSYELALDILGLFEGQYFKDGES